MILWYAPLPYLPCYQSLILSPAQAPGDLWYFPPGVPHVLPATDDLAEGAEFLLVFDDGNFSEDSTFSVCNPRTVHLRLTTPILITHFPAH